MPRDGSRARRVGDQIQRELSTLLSREVSDPRVYGTTVSEVEVSPDLGHARIFVTVPLGGDSATVMEGMNAANAYLRRGLAARLRLRVMPTLKFIEDTTMDNAEHIAHLLAGVRSPTSDEGDGE
jgi:ribosome-binding factor A